MVKIVNICAARFPSVAWKALELPVRLTAFLENTAAGSLLSFFSWALRLRPVLVQQEKSQCCFLFMTAADSSTEGSAYRCWFEIDSTCVGVCMMWGLAVCELLYMSLQMNLCLATGSIKASGSLAIKSKRKACLGSNEFQPSDLPICFHTELILSMSHPHMQTSNISSPAPPLHPLLSLPEFISHVSGLFYQC